jgi:hypothetical protein
MGGAERPAQEAGAWTVACRHGSMQDIGAISSVVRGRAGSVTMDYVGFSVGLVGGLLANILTGFSYSLAARVANDRARRDEARSIGSFWRFSDGCQCVAILYRPYAGGASGAGEGQTTARIEDAYSLTLLTNFLEARRRKWVLLPHDVSRIPDNHDIVCLGGPRVNDRSRDLMAPESWGFGLSIAEDPPGSNRYVRAFGVKREASPMDAGSRSDFGLAACLTDPDGRRAFIICGTHGPGTAGAMKFVTDAESLALIADRKAQRGSPHQPPEVCFTVTVSYGDTPYELSGLRIDVRPQARSA